MPVFNTSAIYRIIRCSLASILPAALFAAAESPSVLLVNQFARIDSIISAFEGSVDLSKCDSARAASALGELLYQHPGFVAAAVGGGNGDMLAAAAFDGMVGEVSGNVSRKEWFKKARETGKPFYSDVQSINGRFCLVWSRPVYSANALGIRTRKGIFTVFVNIGECLKNFSASYRRPFELLRNGTLFYHTDNWRADLPYAEEPVTLMGNVSFTLRYDTTPPEAASDTLGADTGRVATMPLTATKVCASLRDDRAPVPVRPPIPVPYHGALPWCIIGGAIVAAAAIAFAANSILCRKRNRMRKSTAEREHLVEQGRARSSVMADIYWEIRARIERSEIASIEEDARESLRCEIAERIRRNQTDSLREELRASMIEQVKAEAREEIRNDVLSGEQEALRQEARAAIIAEIIARLREEAGAALEIEALQELHRTVKDEVKAEHENGLRTRAFKDLEEKIHRDVAIRERSMLLMQARTTLKGEIEKEIREREAKTLRDEAVTEQRGKGGSLDPAGTEAQTGEMDGERLTRVREAIQSLEKSEELSSLVKTVEALKSQGRSSSAFCLDASQTACMVEYLDQLSIRLQSHFAELAMAVKNACRKPVRDGSGITVGIVCESGDDATAAENRSDGADSELVFADEPRENYTP